MKASKNITIGIDEVGRGPWAGPLLVSAVALDMDLSYDGLRDSKKLTKKRRQIESIYIKQVALGIGLGWVNVNELDDLGMTKSLKLGARRAYNQLPLTVRNDANRLVIDGNINMLDSDQATVLIKADAKVQAVSAASIVAKVARDDYMARLSVIFPQYGFDRHSGYGTKAHAEALRQFGVIQGVHRLSFAPIKRLLGLTDEFRGPQQASGDVADDSTTAIGRRAEAIACEYLIDMGYDIVSRNWRTRVCEIDIVARRQRVTYFVEVKYRHNQLCGDGLAAITKEKLRQMRFAAQVYMHDVYHDAASEQARLAAIALEGDPPVVKDFILLG